METTRYDGEPVSRRRFLDVLIGGSFAMTALTFLGGVLSYMWPARKAGAGGNEPVEVGPETDLPVGQGKVVQYRESSALVIHTKEGLIAFSAVCTHLGCIVKWNASKQEIECPCHGAVFDTKGNVVAGPPPKPLPSLKVGVRSGKIYLGA
jgi:cytochrome b6-f complex iron-sulfur subunit